MRNIILLLMAMFVLTALAADDVIVPPGSGNAYIQDNGGNLLPLYVAYTTDGSGHLKIINSSNPVDDDIVVPPNSGKMYLTGADSKLYPALVLYTTDGSGNVQPISGGGSGVTSVTGTAPVVSSGGTTPAISMAKATSSVDGYLGHLDWATFNAKQSALPAQHDLWVDRNGTDASGCGVLPSPCQTVGYALGLVTSPSQTNNWTIHLMSGRHDQETNDLLITPYTWIVGNGGPDVGSYLRLPSGKAIKISSGWTVNARGGLQSIYLGGGTSVNLDFAALGGSAGSNFMFDDVFVTGTFTQTGRGVNGGDFLYIQNSLIFGAASFTGSEVQSLNSTFNSTITAATSSTVPTDLTFIGGSVGGNFSFTETGGQEASVSISGTSFLGTFSTSGTITTSGTFPSVGAHFKSIQSAVPGATVNANAGTAATCAVSNATDLAGTISLTTTATSPASGIQCAVNFNNAYGVAPICQLTPSNGNAATFAVSSGVFVSTGTGALNVNFANADAVGHAYTWTYSCIETQ